VECFDFERMNSIDSKQTNGKRGEARMKTATKTTTRRRKRGERRKGKKRR
jgi:hypothetical protein